MGIFSRFRRKKEDIDDIRSNVLGETLAPEPVRDDTGRFEGDEPTLMKMPRDLEPMGLERGPEETGRGPPGLEREPISLDRTRETGSYEIIDKLNFMENQLAAIKSQTETINERLKNLEMKLGRRF